MASEPSEELIAEARDVLAPLGPGDDHGYEVARFAHEHAEREVAKALERIERAVKAHDGERLERRYVLAIVRGMP